MSDPSAPDLYHAQRQALLAVDPGYARLLPESPPERGQAPPLTQAMARRVLAEPANNQASLVICVGWGDGSLVEFVAADPVLNQKRCIILTLRGEEPDFAASFKRELLPCLQSGLITMVPIEQDTYLHLLSSELFGQHSHIPPLTGCDFVTRHPLAPAAERERERLLPEIYRALSDRPQLYGNDIQDTFTGLRHGAYNAAAILAAPSLAEVAGYFGHAPVISLGGGPSLSDHLDELRELQDKAVLIAGDSVCPGLLAEGIVPHFTTPLERLAATTELVQCHRETTTWFAGSCVVPAEAVDVFGERCLAVLGGDQIYDWLLPGPHLRVNTGSSTGVFSATVGTELSHGPVYLVGHDLAKRDDASHWAGSSYSSTLWSGVKDSVDTSNVISGYEDRLVPGNNGDPVVSIGWWDRFRSELALHGSQMQARGRRLINVNGFHRTGARIDNTEAHPLPRASELPLLPPATGLTGLPRHPERLEDWRNRARLLVSDADTFVAHLRAVRKDIVAMQRQPPDRWDVDAVAARVSLTERISPGNRHAFAYILRSALHNHTAEMHHRRRTHSSARARYAVLETMSSLAQALINALATLRPTLEEIVDDCC